MATNLVHGFVYNLPEVPGGVRSRLFLHVLSVANLFLQDYLFRLVPGYADSGKGKCSYDPNQENIAVLIGKTDAVH